MKVTRGMKAFGRWICFGMWGISHFMLLLLLIGMIQSGVLSEGILLVLLLSSFWSAVIYFLLMQQPYVELTETGVAMRIVFKKKFYSWDEILQAGILWRMGRGTWYNQIVLVPPNGSRRRYQDNAFILRNFGKLIFFEKTEEARNFIIRHYGPLDFDLSDGCSEQSVVAD